MGTLDGKAFVFSGKFQGHTRASIQSFAKSHGATTLSGISKKADFLVAGENMGESKRTKANRAGVPIITFDEFMDMVNPNAAAAFQTTSLEPSASPDDFLKQAQDLDWESFHPHKHGEALRDQLQHHETHHGGVQPAHFYCSTQLKAHLTLMHPFGHDDEIEFSDLSPDGRWLATGSWMSDNYDRGGVLQIWEVATGRVINQLRISGGVGWPDYKGIEWSPTSQFVGMAFDTNGVGAWDPFDDSNEPVVYAYVTDGWSRPPHFQWREDGHSIFIQCNIDHNWDESDEPDEDRGCWLPVKGTRGYLSSEITPGYFTDGVRQALDPAPEPIDATPPRLTADTIIFPDYDNGTTQGRFVDRSPGYNSPLVHPEQGDVGNSHRINPAFPIQMNDETYWGLVFTEGFVVAPEKFPVEDQINFSLGRHYAWPMTWTDWVVRAPTLQALIQDVPSHRLRWIRSLFQDITPIDPNASWPPELGKTHDDLAQLAADCLLGLRSNWGSHVGDYMAEVALTEILRGQPDRAVEYISSIPEYSLAWRCAEIAFHCLARGYNKQGKKLLKLSKSHIDDMPDYNHCVTNTYWSICSHLLGQPRNTTKYRKLAESSREPQNNSDQNNWPVINMYIQTGQIDEAMSKLVEWGVSSTPFYMPGVWYNMAWYSTYDEMLQFKQACQEHGIIKEWDLADYFSAKILHDRDWTRLETLNDDFPSYKDNIWENVFEHMEDDPKARCTHMNAVLTQTKPNGHTWLRLLNMLIDMSPELAHAVIKHHNIKAEDTSSWAAFSKDKDSCYTFGYSIIRLNLWPAFESHTQHLAAGNHACLLAGVAKGMTPEQNDELLKRALTLIDEETGYDVPSIWHKIASAAKSSGRPDALDYFKRAANFTMDRDKDLEMERMVQCFTKDNHLDMAHRAWMKIPSASRRHRTHAIFSLLCKQQQYDGLHDLLNSMNADDLNDRGQNAVQVLQTLTRSRGHRF